MTALAALLFAATVSVTPGKNVPALVAANPPGTTFTFAPGIYRLGASIVPKDGDKFVGAAGQQSILRGSIVVAGFTKVGNYWVASLPYKYNNPACSLANGCTCDAAHPACNLSEDLQVDTTLYLRMPDLTQMAAGRWYWDLKAGKVYLVDNPTGHNVEVSVTGRGFAGAALNVTVDGFLLERFAGQVIFPRVDGGQWGRGWIVQNNNIKFGHLSGVTMANAMQVLNNTICDNGKLGIAGGGDSDVIEGNEICRNNYAGFTSNRGGGKFDAATNLVVRNNFVHDNLGAGLHTDSGSAVALYEYNHTSANQGPGIEHEISHSATIRYNLVENEVKGITGSIAHGAGIWIYAADGVSVYGNTVINSLNGIAAYQTLRNDNLGTHYVQNLSVHDNSITQPTGFAAGIMSNSNANYYPMLYANWNNRFDNNTYCLGAATQTAYTWNLKDGAKASWQQAGQDVHGLWTCPAPPTNTTPPAGL